MAITVYGLVGGVNFSIAQTKPSVPEFTLRYADNSYDVAPVYGIDSFTGANVTVKAGYHVQNKSIIVIIKNQPFDSYTDSKGNTIRMH